ncbi:MAG: B12-binding domain-containing radical SAM protein [Desulfomonilia bacterium]
MRIALLQLPLQSQDYSYSIENIPLAAGYLASYAHSTCGHERMAICPPEIMNIGGDAALLNWLEDQEPHVVGFSCYLWNIDRTLYLCRRIRELLPETDILLGGPEISLDNDYLTYRGDFDIGIVGEGEVSFQEILSVRSRGDRDLSSIRGIFFPEDGAFRETPPRPLCDALDTILSPYLGGHIGPSLSNTMVLESVRGCPQRCTYCYYHKLSPMVRTFSMSRIEAEFRWARDRGIEEVTLLDPCFGRRPGFMALLQTFERACAGKLPFSCELNAEDLTQERVDALARAGCHHVEIGLQTLQTRTLKRIGRTFNREAFIRGVRMLRDAGIKVMTDIMVGLPGDRLEDVKRSIDFVLEQELCDDLSVYPVSLLPGTVLRSQADRYSVGFQGQPPYLVTSTPDMDSEMISQAFVYAQGASGNEYFPVELPRMMMTPSQGSGGVVHHIRICEHGPGSHIDPGDIGQALAIEVADPTWLNRSQSISTLIRDLLGENPFTVVSWIIPEDCYRHRQVRELIGRIHGARDHPMDREYMASFTNTRSCQIFLQSPSHAGTIYTLIPVGKAHPSHLWAGIAGLAGPREEREHAAKVETLLGVRSNISYHDLDPAADHVLDPFLGRRDLHA